MLVHLINKVQKDSYSLQHLNVIIVSIVLPHWKVYP